MNFLRNTPELRGKIFTFLPPKIISKPMVQAHDGDEELVHGRHARFVQVELERNLEARALLRSGGKSPA